MKSILHVKHIPPVKVSLVKCSTPLIDFTCEIYEGATASLALVHALNE